MKTFFIIGIMVGLICLFWAVFVEPNTLEVKHHRLSIKGLERLKVVFVSDLHLAPSHQNWLNKIVEKIDEQDADLVLFGGDFVKGHQKSTSMPATKIAEGFREIALKYPVYAVLGNHDWWYGGEELEQELAKNEVHVLKNDNTLFDVNGYKLYLAGVEDYYTKTADLNRALRGIGPSPIILLSHSPDVFPNVPHNVSLTLAGHTHGGQVKLPFWGAVWTPSDYGTRYAEGLIEEDGKKMVVTKGIGTSILPIRFNCKPEIVVLEFE